MKKVVLLTVALLLVRLLQSCGNGPSNDLPKNDSGIAHKVVVPDSARKGINDYNTQFAIDAANAGRAKVAQGKLALKKSSNKAVKDFGQAMIDNYSIVNKVLANLTEMKNMTVPRSQGMEEQKVMDSLNQKSGRTFDKAYIGHMVDMYQKEIKYFEEAEERLTDMDLKAFASRTLPILKKYLSQCIQIRNSLN